MPVDRHWHHVKYYRNFSPGHRRFPGKAAFPTDPVNPLSQEENTMLDTVSLFKGMSRSTLEALNGIAVKKEVPANTIVISEGEESDSLFVITRGRAQAVCNDENGKQIILNVFDPPDFFGEMSFFDRASRCATVMTVKRSLLHVIPREVFRDLMTDHPDIAFNLIGGLVQKLRSATRLIENLAFMDVYGRVVRFLTETAGENGVIEDRLTHQEIGNRIGASRETVTRIMNTLLKKGYVEKCRHPSQKRLQLVLKENIPYKP
jgi:CRP/FNR family cyclic AMP-dependent transcriptional regulator